MSDLIEEHLEWCAEISLSPNTINMRRVVLNDLNRYLVALGVVEGVEAARPAEIRAFIATKNSKAWKHNIRNHLNAFYIWATVDAEILDWSPMAKVPRVKVPPRTPRPVDDELLNTIVASASPLWRLVAVLGGWAGLRDCEIAPLAPRHREADVLRVLGKGDVEGIVELHPVVARELDLYPGAAPYIVQAGGRADPRWISRRAGEYYRRLTGQRVTPHMFRHRFITGVLAGTGNLRTAQAAARHASITSTVGYAALVNGERRRGILALPDAGPTS